MISKIPTTNLIFLPFISVKVKAEQLPLATGPLLTDCVDLGAI